MQGQFVGVAASRGGMQGASAFRGKAVTYKPRVAAGDRRSRARVVLVEVRDSARGLCAPAPRSRASLPPLARVDGSNSAPSVRRNCSAGRGEPSGTLPRRGDSSFCRPSPGQLRCNIGPRLVAFRCIPRLLRSGSTRSAPQPLLARKSTPRRGLRRDPSFWAPPTTGTADAQSL